MCFVELRERRAVEQVVARGAVRAHAEPGGRVRLRVEVDDERPLAGLREARGEVDRSRRLADAALLIRKRVDPGHAAILAQARTGAADTSGPGTVTECHALQLRTAKVRSACSCGSACEASRFRHGAWHRRGGQASGRFFATPSGGGSRPASLRLRDDDRPPRSSGSPPPSCSATRATASRSALGPSQRTAAPPGRTSGRHHSTAVGRLRERLRERDAVRVDRLLLRAAPDDARVRRRPPLEEVALPPLRLEQRHLALRAARPRAGSRASRRPSRRRRSAPRTPRTTSTARSASSRSIACASASSRSAVSPGRRENRARASHAGRTTT